MDFVNADGQTVLVDRVTTIGHDDSAPAGQQDVFSLDDSTVAHGQVVPPPPEGGPPQVTVQQTQQLPGVSKWNDGLDYLNNQVKPLLKQSDSNNALWWLLSGVLAITAVLAGIATWVWRHLRGGAPAHAAATANAPTEWHGGNDEQWRKP